MKKVGDVFATLLAKLIVLVGILVVGWFVLNFVLGASFALMLCAPWAVCFLIALWLTVKFFKAVFGQRGGKVTK